MTPNVAKVMAYVRSQVVKAPSHEELFTAIEALLTFEPEHEIEHEPEEHVSKEREPDPVSPKESEPEPAKADPKEATE